MHSISRLAVTSVPSFAVIAACNANGLLGIFFEPRLSDLMVKEISPIFSSLKPGTFVGDVTITVGSCLTSIAAPVLNALGLSSRLIL